VTGIVQLEWDFTPADIFEQDLEIEAGSYRLNISSGKAVAQIAPSVFETTPSMRQALHEELNRRLLGVQLLSYVPFSLSAPTLVKIAADGKRHMFMEAPSIGRMTIFGSADSVLTNAEGVVVLDTKADRVRQKKAVSELIGKQAASDSLLFSMLRSYCAAIGDQENEFVHLYEIREAMADRFGTPANACAAVQVTSRQWSRFGQICNDPQLKRGRHRGQSAGVLRDVTKQELDEVRAMARAMVIGYAKHLQSAAS
jgi:hypothetical protein